MPANLPLIYGCPSLLDRLMERSEHLGLPAPREGCVRHYPPLQMFEDDDALHVRALVPGLSLDDLGFALEGDLLTLRGVTPNMPGHYLKRERPGGPFRREVRLPFPVAAEAVRAEIGNGVLTITLPRKTIGAPRSRRLHGGNGMRHGWNDPVRPAFPDRRRNEAGDDDALLTMPPLTDMVETAEGVHLYCNLPGVPPENISLDVEDGFLHLWAKTAFARVPGKVHALEFSHMVFESRILLPKVDAGRIEASLANGLLRIFMPFPPATKAVRISVAAG